MKFIIGGIIRDGKLAIYDKAAYDRGLAKFLDGQRVVLQIETAYKQRSLRQNAFWWAVVIPLFAEHCGYTHDEMHEILKTELLPTRRVLQNVDGKPIKEIMTGGSTATLTARKFSDLIESAQRLGAEMGIYIPDPGSEAA